MSNKEAIELLENLQDDVDTWDRDDKEIDKLADRTIEALQYAVEIIKSSNVVGLLNIGNDKYFVCKSN